MLLVSEGKGFLGFVLPLGSALAFNVAVGEAYWDSHRWPFAYAMLLAGGATYFLGRKLNGTSPSRELFDPTTGRMVLVKEQRKHRTFWMPLEWWGLLVASLGVLGLFYSFASL